MKSTLYREAAGYLSGKINEVTNLQGSCWIFLGEDKLMKSKAAGYFAEKTNGVKCLLEMCREWIFVSGKSNDKQYLQTAVRYFVGKTNDIYRKLLGTL